MFARTKRLTLRPGWPEDTAALAAAIGHEQVVSKLAQVPWPYGEADAAWWLGQSRAVDDVACLILSHETGIPRLVGTIGLHPIGAGDAHELGYWLTPDVWGRGYATEAGHAMLDIARSALGLKQVHAGYFLDNPASGRVLRKLGFRDTGITRRFSRARDTEVDSMDMMIDLAADEPAQPLPIAA